MDNNSIVRERFNQQAENLDSRQTAKNVEYLQGFCEFMALSDNVAVLDVASGTGDFVMFASRIARRAVGVDISENMVRLSNRKAAVIGSTNTVFRQGDVERLPFADHSFRVVACKSAFHHIPEYERVFAEMMRCCQPGGRIVRCDTVAYKEPAVDTFFERFELLVDRSHARTLSGSDFHELYDSNHIPVERTYELDIEYSIAEYLTHAKQNPEDLPKLDQLVEDADDIAGMAGYWNRLDGDRNTMRFRRKVYLIVGRCPWSLTRPASALSLLGTRRFPTTP